MKVGDWIIKSVKDVVSKENESEPRLGEVQPSATIDYQGTILDGGIGEFLGGIGLGVERDDRLAEGISEGVLSGIARRIAGRAIDMVEAANRTAILHHGIFRFNDVETAEKWLSTVEKNRACQLIFVGLHRGDHAHVIHDCAFSKRQCKCFGFVPVRSTTDRHLFCKLSEDVIRKVIEYNLKPGRSIHYIKIYKDSARSKLSFKDINDRLGSLGQSGSSEGSTMEALDNEGRTVYHSGDESVSGQGDLQHSGAFEGQNVRGDRKRKAKGTDISEQVFRQLMKTVCAPLKEFKQTSTWFESTLTQSMNPQDVKVRVAYNRAVFKFVNMTLHEFQEFYNQQSLEDHKDDTKFHWGCFVKRKFFNHYLPKEESYKVLLRILILQYHPTVIDSHTGIVSSKAWKASVFEFVRWLILWLDAQTGKLNTLYLYGDKASGKTMFAMCMYDYFVCAAELKQWNRNSSFPLEELAASRIVVWNEPNFSTDATPDVLKLAGGDNISAAVKYESSTTVCKRPLICTSNYKLFPTTPEFNIRVRYDIWREAHFTQQYKGRRLHPLALELLFDATENYFEEELRKNNM